MRRRKPFKQVDGNRRNRKQEIPHNDPSVLEKHSYSPTSSIVAKTRHLVNDEAFNFLSSSLVLKVARKHEEHQKKARAEIVISRERSMREKAHTSEQKTESNSSRFGSQTKTPKISNCKGNESNTAGARSVEAQSPKSSNDGGKTRLAVLSAAQTEGCTSKAKRSMPPLKKPKLETIEEEDPMQLSDKINSYQGETSQTNQVLKDSHRLDELPVRGPDDCETRDQHCGEPGEKIAIEGLENLQNDESSVFNNKKIEAADPSDQRTALHPVASAVVASAFERHDMGIHDLSTRLRQDLEIKNDYLEDMELVATDDESLRSSSASSLDETRQSSTCDINHAPYPAPPSQNIETNASSNEAAREIQQFPEFENASTNYQSPSLSVVRSTSKSFRESGPHDDMRSNPTKRFHSSPIMPNSASLSKTPVDSKNVTRQQRVPHYETPRSVRRQNSVYDVPNPGQDTHGKGPPGKQHFHSTRFSAETTVDEILQALAATPPDNAAVDQAMLTSCREDGLLSDGLLNPGYVINVDRRESGGTCDETSEVTCDIDRSYAYHKRKKEQNMPKARKRSKKSHKSVKLEEQSDPIADSFLAEQSQEPHKEKPENTSQEGLSEKVAVIAGYSNPGYSSSNSNPSAKATPGTAEMEKTLRALTPPTNPCLVCPTPMSFEKASAKIPTFESNMDIYSPYLWTAEKAGHFIIEPIFQHVDGKFYRHPPLPPGWTISVSKSRGLPFYHHPDFGSTWYAPVALPMTDGNFAGRRMLVPTHANGSMIPWSGYANQFMKKTTHISSPRGRYSSGSLLLSASDRETMTSSMIPSVLHRETPMLPMVSRNVAFSDFSGRNTLEETSSLSQKDRSLLPSSDRLRPNASLYSTQTSELLIAKLAGEKNIHELNQESRSPKAREVVPLSNRCSMQDEVDSRRGDDVEYSEIVTKFAGKRSKGKVELVDSGHPSPDISAASSVTGQNSVSMASNESGGSSEAHARGILDTPSRSTISGGESRGMIGSSKSKYSSPPRKHDLYFDDFRGVGFNSEKSSRQQERLSEMRLQNSISGVVDLGRKHVCMSQQKTSFSIKADCFDNVSSCSQTSTKDVTRKSNEENGQQSGPIDFESPDSHQSDDIDFPAPDEAEDQRSQVSINEMHLSAHPDESDIGTRKNMDPDDIDVNEVDNGADECAEDSGSSGEHLTTETFESPYDREGGQMKASKVSSIFVPRLKGTTVDEINPQSPGDVDNASVDSWRSRASSLMSTCSHRVRFPPMPICSLQALEACPVVTRRVTRNDRFQKKMTLAKAKKVQKSKKKLASKATR